MRAWVLCLICALGAIGAAAIVAAVVLIEWILRLVVLIGCNV